MRPHASPAGAGGASVARDLVVGFHFDPAAWVLPEHVLADLVVDENNRTERHRRDPPSKTEGVHPQALV